MATLNGETVKFHLKPGTRHDVRSEAPQPVHRAWPQGQFLGAGSTRQRLKFTAEKPSSGSLDANVRRLVEKLQAYPIAVLEYDQGAYYDSDHAFFLAHSVEVESTPQYAHVTVDATYMGNRHSHELALVATSKQIENDWDTIPLTALHVPGGYSPRDETIDDTDRNVMRTPSEFATHDGSYTASKTKRNGGVPVLVPITDAGTFYDDRVQVLDGSTELVGPGHGLTDESIRNKAVDVVLDADNDLVTVQDRLSVTDAVDIPITLGSWTTAKQGGVNLPVTAQRHVLELDNGARVTVMDNGWVVLEPRGTSITITGAATRSTGSGNFYHALDTNTYVVGNVDWSINGSGVFDYGGDASARFAFAYTDASGSALTDRLAEGLADVLMAWGLRAR